MQTFYQRQLAKAREAANDPLKKTSVFIPKPNGFEEETIEVKSLPNSVNISNTKNSLFTTKTIIPTEPTSASAPLQNNNSNNSNPQNKLFESLFKEFEPKIESYEGNSSNPFEYRQIF